MLETYKNLIANQYEAALSTLNTCIDRCPPDAWNGPVGNLAFCQAVFHTLFFADCYLGIDTEALKAQAFHRENVDFFRDYEEMEDREQKLLYDKPAITKYVEHCRRKGLATIAAETEETLKARCGFYWLEFTRAELYVYNIRHIQHHAAQLSLRLRLNKAAEIPWEKSAWRDS